MESAVLISNGVFV